MILRILKLIVVALHSFVKIKVGSKTSLEMINNDIDSTLFEVSMSTITTLKHHL